MQVILRRPPAGKAKWEFDPVDKRPKEDLYEIHDEQRKAGFLLAQVSTYGINNEDQCILGAGQRNGV